MFLKKDTRGQGAIEYLLMIAGAVVVAVVVIVLIQSMASSGADQASSGQHAAELSSLKIGATTLIGNNNSPPSFTVGECFFQDTIINDSVSLPANSIIPNGTYFPKGAMNTNPSLKINGATYSTGASLPTSGISEADVTITDAYVPGFELLVPNGRQLKIGNENLLLDSNTQQIWYKKSPGPCL